MRKVNYKSDFDFILRLHDCKGEEIGWPEYDWRARFWTASRMSAYEASCIGGVCTNCYRDGDRIHIVANNHQLSAGDLHVEFVAEIPNGIYPDGSERVATAELLDVSLVRGNVCPSSFEVELMLPYIKGEPFTYADFTLEQIAELQRPATEAANQLATFETETTQRLDEAESARVTAESGRVSAEETRQQFEKARAEGEARRNRAEWARNEAEESRIQAEDAREEAEQARETAEADRVAAERKRGEIVESYGTALDSKADRSELSNIYGVEILTPETFPEVETLTRAQLREDTFIDIFNAAARSHGKYDPGNAPDPQHPYYLNGIWLTYAEALTIWLDGTLDSQHSGGKAFIHRTNLPLTARTEHLTTGESYLSDKMRFDVEVANVSNRNFPSSRFSAYPINVWSKPFGHARLRRVIGDIDFHFARANINWFVGAVNLEEVHITRLAWSINLGSCARLSSGSVRYMIEQALTNPGHDTPRTITLHPDVYAKLTGDDEEWQGLVELAAEKNITLATA